MTDATRRVPQWIIGMRGAVPLVAERATAEDVQCFVRGHVRWVDGTPGPAVEKVRLPRLATGERYGSMPMTLERETISVFPLT